MEDTIELGRDIAEHEQMAQHGFETQLQPLIHVQVQPHYNNLSKEASYVGKDAVQFGADFQAGL